MKKLFIYLSIVALMVSCKDLTELNRDIKNPEEVPAGTLFSSATVSLFDFMSSANVNVNNFRLWAQQWAQTTYSDESNFELTERDVNGYAFDELYTDVLRDLRESRKVMMADQFLTDENKRNQGAIITVMEVFTYHILVDIFGDLPYTAAFGDDVTPAYDNDKDIYYSLIEELDGAIGDLNGESALGAYDLVYGGDVTLWKKMANTLKLRLAIRIADFDNAKAKAMAEAAAASGVITDASENFQLNYTSTTPNTNPVWVDLVQSGRTDFVAGNTLVDYLNDLNDPRIDNFFNPPLDSNGNYVGGIVGSTNDYATHSHMDPRILDPTYPGIVLSVVEAHFLLADAAARGFNVGGTAEEHYNAGVTASILYWGGTQQEATDYLAQSNVAWDASVWKERIGMQKWIAMYNRGFEAWTTWRLYDAPEMNIAFEVGTKPPLRYNYPVSEYSLNGENVRAAADEYNSDSKYVPVFWDVN